MRLKCLGANHAGTNKRSIVIPEYPGVIIAQNDIIEVDDTKAKIILNKYPKCFVKMAEKKIKRKEPEQNKMMTEFSTKSE